MTIHGKQKSRVREMKLRTLRLGSEKKEEKEEMNRWKKVRQGGCQMHNQLMIKGNESFE
ncbi:hypothetical protein SESBI_02302 [Sesbania bispinosa]|nr:hypothetical protein SESBI_02301 [Sesbania bispinosa]KAJ1440067.1 hypothetical protein SESBI_02302 [Sesbania bispinosa]